MLRCARRLHQTAVGYYRRRAPTTNSWKRPNERGIITENLPGLSRCMGWRLVMEEDASLDASGRTSAADADLYGTGRARASRHSLGRSGNPHPGHLERPPP